jgi:hypothetical protein
MLQDVSMGSKYYDVRIKYFKVMMVDEGRVLARPQQIMRTIVSVLLQCCHSVVEVLLQCF